MWDLKIDTRRLVEGFSTSVLWDRPNILWNKADDWWNDNYVTDSNTAAFLSATGIIDPNKQNYVNNLVIALKNQGLWNKMKAIYPFVSEQRNLLNNTDTFSGWALEGGTLTGGFTDPQGGTTAYKYVNSSTTQGIFPSQTFTQTSTTYTQSIWVKSVSGSNVTFVLASGNGSVGQVNLTATGTWQRVTNTSFLDAGGSFYLRAISDTVNGIYIWHPQVELGNLTDYQVTINAQEQFAAAYKYNLKDPQDTDAAFRLKIFGTWTFTPTGAKPNGTNAYMDTTFNEASNLTSNSVHLSFYSRTTTSSTFMAFMGVVTFTGFFSMIAQQNNTTSDFGAQSVLTAGSRANTNTQGFFLATRQISTEFNSFIRNVKVTHTIASQTLANIPYYIGARNFANAGNGFSDKECAFASMGDGLTDTEAAAFYTIVQQFQTSMNRQINP